MIFRPRNAFALVLLATVSLLLTGCASASEIDRSDARAVSQAAFRAIMSKDFQQIRELELAGGNLPVEGEWRRGTFIRDYTSGERVSALWQQGPVTGLVLGEPTFESYQGPINSPSAPYQYQGRIHPLYSERIVQIPFVLSGKSYIATFVIAHNGTQWALGSSPARGDFFIRFQDA